MPPRNKKGVKKIRKIHRPPPTVVTSPRYASLGIAEKVAANRGQVSRHLSGAFGVGVAADNGDVSGDRGALFQEYASGDGGNVAGDLSTDMNGTADAGDVANLVVGPDADVVTELDAVRIGRSQQRDWNQKKCETNNNAKG